MVQEIAARDSVGTFGDRVSGIPFLPRDWWPSCVALVLWSIRSTEPIPSQNAVDMDCFQHKLLRVGYCRGKELDVWDSARTGGRNRQSQK